MTLICNLFAGPGAGKSTTMAGIFTNLKLSGHNVEMAPEFAKQLTWEERKVALTCQPYIFGKQLFTIHRLLDKVDCVITDSPLLLSSIYGEKEPYCFHEYVHRTFNSFYTLNFYVNRVKPYNPKGRSQNEDGAKGIDQKVITALQDLSINYIAIPGDQSGIDAATLLVNSKIQEHKAMLTEVDEFKSPLKYHEED